jgi:hypothetical protein
MAAEICKITIAGNMEPLQFLETIILLSGHSAIQVAYKTAFQ